MLLEAFKAKAKTVFPREAILGCPSLHAPPPLTTVAVNVLRDIRQATHNGGWHMACENQAALTLLGTSAEQYISAGFEVPQAASLSKTEDRLALESAAMCCCL